MSRFAGWPTKEAIPSEDCGHLLVGGPRSNQKDMNEENDTKPPSKQSHGHQAPLAERSCPKCGKTLSSKGLGASAFAVSHVMRCKGSGERRENRKCRNCNGAGSVTNYICGLRIQVDCRSCKGTGVPSGAVPPTPKRRHPPPRTDNNTTDGRKTRNRNQHPSGSGLLCRDLFCDQGGNRVRATANDWMR